MRLPTKPVFLAVLLLAFFLLLKKYTFHPKTTLNNSTGNIPERIQLPKYEIKNPLVIMIGCIEYDKNKEFSSLPGTKKALQDIYDLYSNTYGYDIISTYNPKEPKTGYQSKKDIERSFLKKVKEVLLKNKASYDGIIVFVSGHGNDNAFIPSDLKELPLYKITDNFNLESLPNFVNKPKLFIMDCCRGRDKIKGIKIDGELHNIYEDMVFLYPNVEGNQVADKAKKGEASHFVYQFVDLTKNVPDIRNLPISNQFKIVANHVRTASNGSECPVAQLQTGRNIFFHEKLQKKN